MILARMSSMCQGKPIEAFGGKRSGQRLGPGRDFFFVAEREDGRCALAVGREFRDRWEERAEDDPPAYVRVLAEADRTFLPLVGDDPAERLEHFKKGFLRVLEHTQRHLQADAKSEAGRTPSLTLTLAYVDGLRLYVGHVGNDRCYLYRADTLHRVTTDQTLAPPPPDRPLVSDPMLSQKPTSVVGGFSDDLESEVSAMDLHPADVVFLCTSGVTGVVPDEIIGQVLRAARIDRSTSLEVFADSIFRAVAERQGKSDSAIALARLSA